MSYNPEKVLALIIKVVTGLEAAHTNAHNAAVMRLDKILEMIQAAKDNPDNSADLDIRAKDFPIDSLAAMCEIGPLWDGDLLSKKDRDLLITHGYAARVSVGGEQGFNAATYKGNTAYCQYYGADSMKEAKATRLARQAMAQIGGNSNANRFFLKDLVDNRPGPLIIVDKNRPNNGNGNMFAISKIEYQDHVIKLTSLSADFLEHDSWVIDNALVVTLDSEGECIVIDRAHKTIRMVFRVDIELQSAPDLQHFRDVIEGKRTWEQA